MEDAPVFFLGGGGGGGGLENFHMIIVVVSLFLCGRKRMNKITELR